MCKPFFRRNTCCISRENGAAQGKKEPLPGRFDSFQIHPRKGSVFPMKCPFCGDQESKVVDSRHSEDGLSIRRRRECMGC